LKEPFQFPQDNSLTTLALANLKFDFTSIDVSAGLSTAEMFSAENGSPHFFARWKLVVVSYVFRRKGAPGNCLGTSS